MRSLFASAVVCLLASPVSRAADTSAPALGGVTVSNITATSVTVDWATNEPATGEVQYGLTTSYTNSRTDTSLVTKRIITLTGLTPNTVYQYRVRSRDAAGNTATSPNWNFKTAASSDTAAPILGGVTVSNITATSVTVDWATNEPATGEVQYGLTTSYGSSKVDTSLVTKRVITLTGLTPNTVYQYRVRSRDAAGNTATSPNWNFKTAASSDTVAPVLGGVTVANITATSVTVDWATNEPATGEVQYGLTTSYGSSRTDASLATRRIITLSGLTPNTVYQYRVRSRDAAGNTATSPNWNFKTAAGTDAAAPVISGVSAGSITASGATIVWTTNEASDSEVLYGTTTAYGSSSGLNTAKVTSHSAALSGLAPATTYHYRVRSRDAAGNLAVSGDFTLTTDAGSADTTAPVISSVAAGAIGATTAVMTWTTDEPSDSAVVYGATTAYGSASPADATKVTAHSVTLTGLIPGTVYHCQVRSTDASGNTASSADYTFTTAAGSTPSSGGTPPLTYSAPHCDNGVASAGAPWACGPWPATTAPRLGPANTATSDPDTGNRVLRVTEAGSLGQTTTASFFTNYGGWEHDWAADDSAFIVRVQYGDGGKFWVGFDPANMKLTGASGRLPSAFAGDNFAFDETDPAVIIGVQGSRVVAWNRFTNTTTKIFDITAVTSVFTTSVQSNRICVANGPQDGGYIAECYNRATGAKQVINVRAQTINGERYTIWYKGGITTQAGAGIHALTLSEDGRWAAFDLHSTSACSAAGLSNYTAQQGLIINLDTNEAYSWSLACGNTHWALGFDGAMVHAASPQWTPDGFNQAGACPIDDDRGFVMRTAGLTVDSSIRSLYCPPGPSAWTVGTHLSWQNNRDDEYRNMYPVVGASFRHTNSNKFLFNDIFAIETTKAAKQARIWRFAQTWNDVKTANCDFLAWTSPTVSRSGRFVAFPSNWMGQTGSGACTNGKRTDVFVFELK